MNIEYSYEKCHFFHLGLCLLKQYLTVHNYISGVSYLVANLRWLEDKWLEISKVDYT